jgi:GntR family transcriptional regulator
MYAIAGSTVGATMRTIRYQQIADEMRARLAVVGPGRVLPSESDLSGEFGVSRVTIRRALEILRDEGLVDARQGFGWYVAGEPLRQHLDELGTIEGQLERRGVKPERRVIEFAYRTAPARVAEVLGTDQVLRVKRLNLADGEPFALVTVWCPAELSQNLSRRDVEQHPFYELLDVELRGATQTIGADSIHGGDADLLHVPAGSPVLRCERITTDTHGHPVLMSEHVFPARRTEFVVDLPYAEPSVLPGGLRLVE